MGCSRLITEEVAEELRKQQAGAFYAAQYAQQALARAADAARMSAALAAQGERQPTLPPSSPPATSTAVSNTPPSSYGFGPVGAWSPVDTSPDRKTPEDRASPNYLPVLVGPNAPDYGSKYNPLCSDFNADRFRATMSPGERPVYRDFGPGERFVRIFGTKGEPTGAFWVREGQFRAFATEARQTGRDVISVMKDHCAVEASWQPRTIRVSILTVPKDIYIRGYAGVTSFQTRQRSGDASPPGGAEQIVFGDKHALEQLERKGALRTYSLEALSQGYGPFAADGSGLSTRQGGSINRTETSAGPATSARPGGISSAGAETPAGARVWRTKTGGLAIQSRVEPAKDRQHFEAQFFRGVEVGLPGWDRAHSQGPGTGHEEAAGIRYAPEEVNRVLQNHGVEATIRELCKAFEGTGVVLTQTTETETHPGTLRLKSITYRVEGQSGSDRPHILFEANITIENNRENPHVEYSASKSGGRWD